MGERVVVVVEWSHLPTEILPLIANSIRNRIDLFRFRGVCKSWRSSVPLPHPNSPSFPINVPPLITSHPHHYRGNDFILTQTTLYHITPPTNTNNSNDSYPKGWLIQVEEDSNCLPLRLFHPISNRRIMDPPKLWDLSHCGILELCKCYTIKFHKDGDHLSRVTKVVLFPNPCGNVEDFVVFCIFQEGRLVFMRKGDPSWALVDDKNFHYDDVIVYKGQFYVVDRWGTVSWIDVLSLRLIQYSPPVASSGGKKDLVESCGGLYVVERYYEGEAKRGTRDIGPDHDAEVVDFKVYKLDEELGSWVDVKRMDDRVFVLGDRCSFSVSAKEFAGYHGNCIYFFDFNHVRMYNLSNGSIVKVGGYPSFSNLFWPPPSWLKV